jgi:hypothetical protein
LFSFRVAIPIIGILLAWIWVVQSAKLQRPEIKIAGWALIFLAALAGVWFLRDWVDAVLHWDTLQTVRTSGMVQFIFDSLPDWLHFPFILVYGIFQPVLPAAIAAPARGLWRALGIFRAVGWYALLPLLAYASLRIWRIEKSKKRRWLILIIVMVWAWILIASARAGGDQWDNPRYRTIFLPWMAIIGGWALAFSRRIQDAWMPRILLVEGIFLAGFTFWYLGRYNTSIPRPGLGLVVVMILILSGVVIGMGWFKERQHDRHLPQG